MKILFVYHNQLVFRTRAGFYENAAFFNAEMFREEFYQFLVRFSVHGGSGDAHLEYPVFFRYAVFRSVGDNFYSLLS